MKTDIIPVTNRKLSMAELMMRLQPSCTGNTKYHIGDYVTIKHDNVTFKAKILWVGYIQTEDENSREYAVEGYDYFIWEWEIIGIAVN